MNLEHIKPEEWLTDEGLTESGKKVREDYGAFCRYLDSCGLQSFQVARAKYFLQQTHYRTLPEGFALPPHTINVCVNNLCNMHCKYCDFGQKQDDTFYHKYNVVDPKKLIELTFDICKSIVDQSKWFRPIIRASFREPMLYKEIIPFIRYTKENGLPFWLLTNGYNLSKNADELVDVGLDSIRLSLDGPAEVHDIVRGTKDAYGRMIDGVKRLLERKESRQSNLQVGFYFTINDLNYDKLLATVEALDSEGILSKVFLNFQWLLYTTEKIARDHNREHAELSGARIEESTVQNVDIYKMDLQEMSRQREEIAKRFPVEKGYRIYFRPSFDYDDLVKYRDTEDFPVENPACKVLWYNMNINPAGDVKCFHHCLLPDTGNVYKNRLLDIWNGDVLRNQRMKLKQYGAYRGCTRCWGVYSLLEDKKRKD